MTLNLKYGVCKWFLKIGEKTMNYLTIVNKSNLIEDSYYEDLKLIECNDIFEDCVKVEKLTYSHKEILKSIRI